LEFEALSCGDMNGTSSFREVNVKPETEGSDLASDDSDACQDSDFGLASWQLEDLWRCCFGDVERALTEAGSDSDGRDSDFGLSSRQITVLALNPASDEGAFQDVISDEVAADVLAPRDEVASPNEVTEPRQRTLTASSVEERRVLASLMPDESEVPTPLSILHSHPTPVQQGEDPLTIERERSAGAVAPRETSHLEVRRVAAKPPRVAVLSSRAISGVTWYLLRVKERSDERVFIKRYADFKRLDRKLRRGVAAGEVVISIPHLPQKGVLGIRHRLDLGHFNADRLEGLRLYIEQLISQVQSLEDVSQLKNFLGPNAPGIVHVVGMLPHGNPEPRPGPQRKGLKGLFRHSPRSTGTGDLSDKA
jgi:hypothetical protein